MLTTEKFRGCVIGQCVGDALGMPVERQPLLSCRKYVDQICSGEVGRFHHPDFAFGQYTDDSQLMREMLISFVSCEDFIAEDYARRIAKIYSRGEIVGSSTASRKVAERLKKGVSWKESGTQAPYARNGSSMRSAPVGLFFYDNPERLVKAACDQGNITHQDPRASAGAVTIAAAVAIAVQSSKIVPITFIEQLSTQVRLIEPSFAMSLQQLAAWTDLPIDAALERIAPMGNPSDSLEGWEGISPWVVPSVLWSLYSFLRSPQDYWQTICTAISGGGDTDTTAAMAGAISGAFLGLEAIPVEVSYRLTDQGKWGYKPLLALADLGFHLTRVRQLMYEEGMVARWTDSDAAITESYLQS